MSKEELRLSINELLEKTNELVLNEVYEYLKAVEDKSSEGLKRAKNLKTILSEDANLLMRLAK